MRIAIGCDHGGLNLKPACEETIDELGFERVDFGTFDSASVDYPIYAEKVCRAVLSGECDRGVLLCGTGIGMSVAANKFKGIRCARVGDVRCAEMAARHNDANVIAMGGRTTAPDECKKCLRAFLTAEFEGGRHARRLEQIRKIEEEN